MKKLFIILFTLASPVSFAETCNLMSYWKFPTITVINPGKEFEALEVNSFEDCVIAAKERLKLTKVITVCDLHNAPATRSLDFCDTNRVAHTAIIKKVKYSIQSEEKEFRGYVEL
jgi:hypothetical protein